MQEAGGEAGGGGAPAPVADTGGESVPSAAPATPDAGAAAAQRLLDAQQSNKRLAAELRKIQAERDAMRGELDPLRELDKLLGDDPLAALKKKGHHYNDITKRVLKSAEEQLTPEQRELAELKKWKEDSEQRAAKDAEERKQAQEKENQQQLVAAITTAIDARPDLAYSSAIGAAGAIHKRMQQFLADNGYVPDAEQQEEIAATVEKEAREAVTTQVKTLIAKSPEFRQVVQELISSGEAVEEPGQQAEPPAEEEVEPKPRPRSRTVTQQQKTAVGGRVARSGSHAERRAEAIRRLEARHK